MIKPAIGRVAWYHPPRNRTGTDQPHAALIAHVWNDTCVNLAVFDANGFAYSKTSVFLFQGDSEKPGSGYAAWMPYQQGQAAKTEALEKKLNDSAPKNEGGPSVS